MFIKILTIIAAALSMLYGGWTLLASATDELIVGKASVIDGDTFAIGSERVRLFGVDAPEASQVCDYKGKKWLCGSKAALDLADWMGKSTIVCRRRGKSYDHVVASCVKGVVDVASWTVSQGMSVAETCSSRSYVADQERARASGTGIWSSTFDSPKVIRSGSLGQGCSAAVSLSISAGKSSPSSRKVEIH